MTSAADQNLLKPQKLSGIAVERDEKVKDLNHSPPPAEETWIKNSLAQDAEITASQKSFFAKLRERSRG